MSSVPPAGPAPGSVPPISPPPNYTGDQPTVPNPVYRGPVPTGSTLVGARKVDDGTSGGSTAGGQAASSTRVTKGGGSSGEKAADGHDGRRGNVVIGLMLVAGLVIIGLAAMMLNSTGEGGAARADTNETPGEDTEGLVDDGGEMPISAARQDDGFQGSRP